MKIEDKTQIIYKNAVINSNVHLNNLSSPFMVSMMVTRQCQLRCRFCSQEDATNQCIDFTLAKRILQELSEYGIMQISYTGGEPLLYDSLVELAEYGASLGFVQSVITNGIAINRFVDSKMFDYISMVGVSLHGKPETHDQITGVVGSHKTVLDNLYCIRDKYPKIKISINFTYCNLNNRPDELDAVVQLAKKIDMSINVARINQQGRAKTQNFYADVNNLLGLICKYQDENIAIRLGNCIPPCIVHEKYSHITHGCGAGVSFCAIDSEAMVKICPTAGFAIGDLKREDFSSIWNNPDMRRFRSLDWLPIRCTVCKSLLKCTGACKIEGNSDEWPSFQDSLVLNEFHQDWSVLFKRKLCLKTNKVRSEEDLFLILAEPMRLCSDVSVDIIKKMDGTLSGEEIIAAYKNTSVSHDKIKELILALHYDNLIQFD